MQKLSRLYVKILSYFLTLALLIGIVGSVSYFTFFRQRERDFFEHIASNMTSVQDSFTQYLTGVVALSDLFLSARVVETNLKPYPLLTTQNRAMLGEIILYLQNGYNILDSSLTVDVFTYVDEEKVYYNQGMTNSEMFFGGIYSSEKYGREFWMSLLKGESGLRIMDSARVTKLKSVNKNVLPIVRMSYINGYPCVFAVFASVDALAAKYYGSAVFQDSLYVITDYEGLVVYAPNALSGLDLSQLAHSSAARLGGVDYGVVSSQYAPFGWRAYCLTPTNAIMRVNEFYLFIATALCAGFVLLAVALSCLYSRKIYAPILGVRRNIGQLLGEGSEARGDELKYISERVSDIIRHTDDFVDERHLYLQRYAKARLLEIINGAFINDEQQLLYALREEFDFTSGYMGCAIAAYNADIPRSMYIAHQSGLVICVYSADAPGLPEIAPEGDMGIGAAHEGAYGVCASFEEAADMYLVRAPANGEFRFDNARLAAAIRLRDFETARDIVLVMTDALNSDWPGYARAREAVRSAYNAAISVLGAELYRQCDALRMRANDYLGVLLAKRRADPEPIIDFIRTTIELLPEGTGVQRNYELAQKARMFVDDHYFEDLSLDIIAGHIGVSGKYVSKIFKDETSVNLSDYIALVRVEHAKRLLQEGIAINAVAPQVGMESRATFIRVFKKITGMTPSEYRDDARGTEA